MAGQDSAEHAQAGADQWLTRREAARLAGCSEDTIKRAESLADVVTKRGDKGEVLIGVAGLMKIGRLRPQDVPAGASASQVAENKRLAADNARLAAQVAELTGRLREIRGTHDVVVAQLAVKDQQIKDLMALARAAR